MPFDETATEQFLSVDQVASRYNTSKDSIYRWKREGDFTKAVHLGKGATRWRLSDLVAYETTLQCSYITHLWSIAMIPNAN